MKLRPYQKQAHDRCFELWPEYKSLVCVMFTGGGKTVVFAHIIKTFLDRNPDKKVMVLAERDKIVTQGCKTIGDITGKQVEIEMASHHVDMRGMFSPQIVIGTVQTQARGGDGLGRLGKFDPMDFGLLIIDESHHAVSGTYRKLIDYYTTNEDLRILGVTATPDRHDKQALGKVFQAVACDFDIHYGCDEGWLMYPWQRMATIASLDISHVGKVGGDFNAGELESELIKDKPVVEIARAAIDHCGDKKTIIFCIGVDQAQRLCDLINSENFKPGSACFICGKTDKAERERTVADFKRGKYQFLCNVGIAVEGWDDPEVAYIVDAAPTLSRAKYTQKLGRMLRPSESIAYTLNDCADADERKALIAASDKPRAEYIDLAMNCGRLKPVFIGDILGGDYSEEVRQRAKKHATKAGERGEAVDMADVLAKADAELKREKERQSVRRAKLKAKAEYRLEQIDPFNVYDIRKSAPASSAPTERGKLSDKQRAILEKQGIRNIDAMPYADAKALIDRIAYGWQHGLASYKQTMQLRRFGYPAMPYTREQAHNLLNKEFEKRQSWRDKKAVPRG